MSITKAKQPLAVKSKCDQTYLIDDLDWQLVGILIAEWKRWLPGREVAGGYIGGWSVDASRPANLGDAIRLSVEFTNNFAIFKVSVQPDNTDAPIPLMTATLPYKQIIEEVKTRSHAKLKGCDLAMKMRGDLERVFKGE